MSLLQPHGGKEGLIVGDFRWVGGRGLVNREDDYLAPSSRRDESLRWMSQDGFCEMAAYLRANLGRLSEFDEMAWKLLMDDDKRRTVVEEMKKTIPGWGGYLPVMDRDGQETVMVEIDQGEDYLSYFILGRDVSGQGTAWYRLKDLWPVVMYENWRTHNQRSRMETEDDD